MALMRVIPSWNYYGIPCSMVAVHSAEEDMGMSVSDAVPVMRPDGYVTLEDAKESGTP